MRAAWILLVTLLAAPAWAQFVMPGSRARTRMERSPAYMFVPSGDANVNIVASTSTQLTVNQATCQTMVPSFTLTRITKLAWRVVLSAVGAHCSLCLYDGATAGAARLHSAYTALTCASNGQDRLVTGIAPFDLLAGKKYAVCMISEMAISVMSSSTLPTIANAFANNEYTAVTTATTGACPATLPAFSATNITGAFVGMVSSE